MIVFGLVLLAVVIGASVIVVSSGGDRVDLHLHWFTLHTSGAALFVAGMAALVLATAALWSLRAGIRRSRRRRKEMKTLRAQASHSPSSPTRDQGHQAPSSDPPRPRRQDADDYFDTAPRD